MAQQGSIEGLSTCGLSSGGNGRGDGAQDPAFFTKPSGKLGSRKDPVEASFDVLRIDGGRLQHSKAASYRKAPVKERRKVSGVAPARLSPAGDHDVGRKVLKVKIGLPEGLLALGVAFEALADAHQVCRRLSRLEHVGEGVDELSLAEALSLLHG